MQKSITSFFGAPKEGAGTVPSPQKPRSPPSTKPPPKPKAKAKAKTNSKPKGKVVAAAAAAAAAGASAKAKPSATSSPAKAGSRAEEDGGEKGGSPFKKAVGKRKTEEAEEGAGGEGDGGVGAAGTQKLKQKVEKEAEQEEGGGEEEEEEEEEEAPVQTKRLRRLAKKVAVEDSDDEMFGEGDGAGEKAANGKANAMEVDDGEDDDKENSSADPAKTMKARPTRGSAKTEGKENSARKAAETEKETDEEEPDTAAEEGQDDDDDEDAEEEEDEDDEDEEDDEEDGDKEEEEVAPKRKGGTVTMALMAGAKKAKNAPTTTKKKVVKGSTAASIVVAKTEDLVAKASWKKGQPVPFEAMAEVFDRVEQTSKRLEIQEILRGFLCTVISLTPDDLVPCVYLACNELAPAYEGVELGIGDAVLQKAIQGATGRSAKDIKAAAVKAGDLGEVAQHSTKAQGTLSFGQKIKSLSARDILESYRAIARVKGNLSQDDKINRIKKMLVSCKGLQAKYIIRGLQGKMRIGLSVTTVMVSLSHAAVTCPSDAALAAEEAEKILEKEKEKLEAEDDEGQTKSEKKEEGDEEEEEDKEAEAEGGAASTAEGGDGEAASLDKGEVDGLIPVARKLRATRARDLDQRLELATQLVKQAYSECPNLDLLIKAILTSPLYRLQQTCRLTPGVPVSPMLAKPTKSIGEVLQRLSGQEFTCEYKYDGVRAQVHLMADGSLRFFSRSSKDSSSELPDLIPVMKDCVTEGVQSYVIDTEVVAYDRDTGNLLPFQMLSTRGRKDVDAKDVKVKVIVEAFDILYLNGKSLLQHPLQERRKALRNTFKEVDGRFRFATFMDHKEDGDTEPIEEFLSEAVKGNCEGLMVKTLNANSSYEPSKRSLNWLKLKKDYLQPDGGGVGDSLDLVPIGAFFGKGKRTGKYGAYLLACYEPDREEYQSVCKIGTGFTDEILLSFWTELKEHTVEKRPRYFNVADSLAPDVWLEPHKVWEVKCADLSKSPVHKAAIGKLDPDRGISIRFPRLLRERLDKDPEQATTSDQILDMYESQDVVKSNAAGAQTINADDDWEL